MYTPSKLEQDHVPPTPAEVREIIEASTLPAYKLAQLMEVSRQTMWVWSRHGSLPGRNKPMTWEQARRLQRIEERGE